MERNFEFVQDEDGEVLRIAARGREILDNPLTNFGTAFTRKQRKALGVYGLLPSGEMTISDQLKRVYHQYISQPDDLSKYLYLQTLHNRNEVLYYRLLEEHIEEMLPIVYTPTIGLAIEQYSSWYYRSNGIYLSIDEPEEIEHSLKSMGHESDEVDLIVATDSEGILGIGDQGVGGIAITVGKLAVYTAAAGIHPQRVLPVVLDVGTDNLALLNDPGYVGAKHARVRGERYEEFVEKYVETAHRLFPHALLHWEDFGAANATRILNKYKQDYCTFNDDIQGTAAVVVAAILTAAKVSGTNIQDQRIVIYGAGSAGVGIANLILRQLMRLGIDREQAIKQFWGISSHGLLREGLAMRDFQQPFSRSAEELSDWILETPGEYNLKDVVRNVEPTILIGSSAQSGAFSQDIVETMAENCERPIIMPLSNPTSKAEAKPDDLLRWTKGKALIATGSPFDPIIYEDTKFDIAQANNALVFPGIGLGVIACGASQVSDGMIAAAAQALSEIVDARRLGSSLLPKVSALREISARVALAVAQTAKHEGLATKDLADNPIQSIYAEMWQPRYPKVEVVERL